MQLSYAPATLVLLLWGCGANAQQIQEPAATSTPAPKVPGTPLDGLLTEVQKALQTAQDTLAQSHLPPLESVRLTLYTQSEKDATGKIKIFIISFGGGSGASNSQELALTLVPPKPKLPSEIRLARPAPTAADSIVELIKEAAHTVRIAETGPPPLVAKNLTLDLAFTVTTTAGGGIQFNVGYVSVDVGGDVRNLSKQRITITFAR